MIAVAAPGGHAYRWRRRLARGAVLGLTALLVASLPWLWTTAGARGHVYDEADAPAADVVIVLGTAVAADRRHPENRLAGRLETAAELVHSGRARVVLVSGDGGGASGDEPAVMTTYLTERLGVDPRRIVADPYGLDTYDSCARAREVYGVERALVVTQSWHVSRAVTLCRHLGLDVDGVIARCPGCGTALFVEKTIRDYLASGKAAWDAVPRRPPAVHSPADSGVRDALTS
ncbi:ElyC/SanA/YdcF family protein [Micromonospora sp. NPDC047707]|uniref:SanA/YdcF family protein n=1 Tax=Micromonospora sp. NPDC047707 TaxID=3154498 RepID=UPI00345567D9